MQWGKRKGKHRTVHWFRLIGFHGFPFAVEGSSLVSFIALGDESGANFRPLLMGRAGDDRQMDASQAEADAVHPPFGWCQKFHHPTRLIFEWPGHVTPASKYSHAEGWLGKTSQRLAETTIVHLSRKVRQ